MTSPHRNRLEADQADAYRLRRHRGTQQTPDRRQGRAEPAGDHLALRRADHAAQGPAAPAPRLASGVRPLRKQVTLPLPLSVSLALTRSLQAETG